jgi:hypothetical protein
MEHCLHLCTKHFISTLNSRSSQEDQEEPNPEDGINVLAVSAHPSAAENLEGGFKPGDRCAGV